MAFSAESRERAAINASLSASVVLDFTLSRAVRYIEPRRAFSVLKLRHLANIFRLTPAIAIAAYHSSRDTHLESSHR